MKPTSLKLNQKSNKAQVSQIFTYILAFVVVGVIVLFGTFAVRKLMEKGDQAEFINFKTDLNNLLADYTSFGKSSVQKIRAPGGYTQLCFVDIDRIENTGSVASPLPDEIDKYPIIKDSITQKGSPNVFLYDGTSSSPIFQKTSKIDLPEDSQFLCIDNENNLFTLKLTGKGRKVLIENA